MRRLIATSLVAGILALVAVMPVAAGTREDVTIVVTQIFEDESDTFTADGLAGCESGLVTDFGHVQFTRTHGVFAGFKEFDCGNDTGFVLRLNARFGDAGSVGTWTVVRSWGLVAGIHGAGTLTGDPFEGGITDTYVGTLTF
jgi:hypothetical protein